MLTRVDGVCEPFSDEWLSQLDGMAKEQALEWIQKHIRASESARDRYLSTMLKASEADMPGLIHCYCIDCNNVLRFTKLFREVKSE